jgi:hypothetical protein
MSEDKADEPSHGAMTLSAPVLDSLSPDTASVSEDGKLIVALNGSGFTMHSTVYYNEWPQPTGMLAPDLLTSPLDPAVWEPTTIKVTVRTGDELTQSLPFTLTP